MGLRVRSGYLLTLDLNRVYKILRDFRAFSWEVTQKVMARRIAEMTVFDYDASLLDKENTIWTPSVTARWGLMIDRYKKSRRSGVRDPETDMETTFTIYPLSTVETLILLQTEVVEVRAAWDSVQGVNSYNHDSISGPEDDDSQEAYYQRGERWRKVLDDGPGFVFKCLGDSYPTPMRNLVLESIPPWEKRLHKAGTILAAERWSRENPKGTFTELMSWITSTEGSLARMDGAIVAELEGKLPNPFPVEILYPPEKA